MRRYRFPWVVDGFLVPATAEPLIACILAGLAQFDEREIGGPWQPHRVRPGDMFVTRSMTPYELRWGGLPIARLRKVEDYVQAPLTKEFRPRKRNQRCRNAH